MRGRTAALSDPEVVRLLTTQFVPAAENCSHAQSQPDRKGEFFRLVAEQGHYGGKTKPTATRQGHYICTAAGELLASGNVQHAEGVLELIRRGMAAWAGRRVAQSPIEIGEAYERAPRYYRQRPPDTLVLHQYVRDLPREGGEADHRHNHDFLWILENEWKALLDLDGDPEVPAALTCRIARFHLVDRARGESSPFKVENVKLAEMSRAVEESSADWLRLRLDGRFLLVAQPNGNVNPFNQRVMDREVGVDARLLGYVTYDRQRNTFRRFNMVATGIRWGMVTYNDRFDDWQPAPIGFAFELAEDTPLARTLPQAALHDEYFAPLAGQSA